MNSLIHNLLDDIVYQESEGDLTLMYFGTIRGDE